MGIHRRKRRLKVLETYKAYKFFERICTQWERHMLTIDFDKDYLGKDGKIIPLSYEMFLNQYNVMWIDYCKASSFKEISLDRYAFYNLYIDPDESIMNARAKHEGKPLPRTDGMDITIEKPDFLSQ